MTTPLLGRLSGEDLGITPFWLIADLARGNNSNSIIGVNLGNFNTLGMGATEWLFHAGPAFDALRMYPFKRESFNLTYRNEQMEREVTIHFIAPIHFFNEAVQGFKEWIEERDMETHTPSAFHICVWEGWTSYNDNVAWWSLGDACLWTFDAQVADELMQFLNEDPIGFKALVRQKFEGQQAEFSFQELNDYHGCELLESNGDHSAEGSALCKSETAKGKLCNCSTIVRLGKCADYRGKLQTEWEGVRHLAQ